MWKPSPSEPLTRPALRARALGLLSRREYSRAQLQRRLDKLGEPEDVQAVLTALTEVGWLSDQRAAQSALRQVAGKNQGPLKLAQKLHELGVDKDTQLDALDDVPDWDALAMAALRKKFPQLNFSEPAPRARALRFLAGRGFSSAQAYRVLRRVGAALDGDSLD